MMSDVIYLPFRVTGFNEDALLQINRNFSEIELMLGNLQRYMNATGYDVAENMEEFMGKAITYGLDTQKPRLTESVKDFYKIYYATDTKKAYISVSR
jgi:hypothetical protein